MSSVDGLNSYDEELLSIFKNKNIPYLIVFNKVDLIDDSTKSEITKNLDGDIKNKVLFVSATTKVGIEELKKEIG